MSRIIAFGLCVTTMLAIGASPAHAAILQAKSSHLDRSAVDSVVRHTMRTRQIPGAAVAILLRDSVIFSGGYGVTDLRTRVPVTTRTIFQIASTTKPFTALVVLQLVHEGKLSLAAPVRTYLPWLHVKYSALTLQQLLQHTSGVRYDLRRQNVDEFNIAEFKSRLDTAAVAFPAGTKWQYSNTGYTLLALAAEAVSGTDFGTLLQERIFEPARMHDSGYRVAQKRDRQHAIGYDLVDGALTEAPHVFSGWGNSGIESTVVDLSKWVTALQSGRLLPDSLRRRMEQPGTLGGGERIRFEFAGAPASYGLGWFLTTFGGRELITHGGAIAGFNSIVNRIGPLTIIVLSNGKQGADRRGQANVIADAIFPLVPAQP